MFKICKVCGKEFDTKGTVAKCCSPECKEENAKLVSRMISKRNRNKAKRPKGQKSNMKQINDIAVEARKHGMSYGQYVAQMQFQKVGGSSE